MLLPNRVDAGLESNLDDDRTDFIWRDVLDPKEEIITHGEGWGNFVFSPEEVLNFRVEFRRKEDY